MNNFQKIRCVMVIPQDYISILNPDACFSIFGRISGHAVYSDVRISRANLSKLNSKNIYKSGSRKGFC